MPARASRRRLLATALLLTTATPVAVHARVPFDGPGAERPDLVVEATLRLMPTSPMLLLLLSVIAGALALLLSARNTLVLQSRSRRQEHDLISLRARERRLRLAVQDGEDGVLHLEPVRDAAGAVIDFLLTEANARAAALFRGAHGAGPGLLTSTFASVAPDTPLFQAFVHALSTGAPWRGEVRAHPRRVATSWLLVRAVRVDDGLAITLTDIRERKREAARLRRASFTDPLTGLLNRRGFTDVAERQLATARSLEQNAVLFYIDCDEFKAINDTFGHAVGDRALSEVARALRLSLREADLVARMGGDEFTILALDAAGDCTNVIRSRIAERLEALNHEGALPSAVSVSVGSVYVAAAETRSLNELLDEADRDLFRAKRARRELDGTIVAIAASPRSPTRRGAAGRSSTRTQLTEVASVA